MAIGIDGSKVNLQYNPNGVMGMADAERLERNKILSQNPLAVAASKPQLAQLSMDTLTLTSISTSSLNKPLMEMELKNEKDSYSTVNYNGRDFYLYDSENEKYLNDPNVRVSETGYLLRHESGFNTLGGTVHILGKAVDAPDYVPPKYTADFFDTSADFISASAQALADHNENEIRSGSAIDRNIDAFTKSALDFFSSGNATQAEAEITKSSIESIIKELAQMLKNGEEADFNKLQNKVNIMGKEVSLSDLLDMQKYGKELSSQLVGDKKERVGLGSDDVGEFARKGMIKSMGMAYGDQIGGAAGELFKSAWGAEVDRHVQIITDSIDKHYSLIKDSLSDAEKEGVALHHNILKNGASYLYDVSSKVDTSNRENALASYKALSGEIDAAINKFLDQYTSGVPGGLATKMRSEVDSYFYDLMGFKSVDVQA